VIAIACVVTRNARRTKLAIKELLLHSNTTPLLILFLFLFLFLSPYLPPSYTLTRREYPVNTMTFTTKDFLKDQFAALDFTPQDLTGKTIIVTGSNVGTALLL